MNKTIKNLIIISLLISILPFTLAIATPTLTSANPTLTTAKPVAVTTMAKINSPEAKQSNCEIFLKKNTKLDPSTNCKAILEDSTNCEELLSKENVSNPALKCKAIKSTKRVKIAEVTSTGIKKELRDKVVREQLFKKRVMTKNKITTLRNRYETIKERLKGFQKSYKERRQKVISMKSRLKECKNDNSSECNDFREEAKIAVKDHLKNGINVAITHLETIKTKIEASENLDETQVTTISNSIDNEIERLNLLISEVDDATTRAELNNVTRKVAREWSRIKIHAKIQTETLIYSKTGDFIRRAEALEKKLDCNINNSAENEKVSEFKNLISLSKENHEKAAELFKLAKEERIDDVKGAIETLKNSRIRLQESQKNLRNAHKILVEILKEIRSNGDMIKNCNKGEATTEGNATA